jgi:hypothetical protein
MGKSGLDDVFKKTEAEQPEIDVSDLDRGNIQSTGVGLRKGEIDALDAIGESLGGIARNALIRFAVRRFLLDYRAGKVDMSGYLKEPEPPKPSLRFPGEE